MHNSSFAFVIWKQLSLFLTKPAGQLYLFKVKTTKHQNKLTVISFNFFASKQACPTDLVLMRLETIMHIVYAVYLLCNR